MIGYSADFALRDGESVVVFASPERRCGETIAEFHALDGGDAVDNLGNPAFHAAEHGFADAGGQAGDGAFHDAAYAVARHPRRVNGGPHLCPGFRIEHRPLASDGVDFRIEGIEGGIPDTGDGGNMGGYGDAPLRQPLPA